MSGLGAGGYGTYGTYGTYGANMQGDMTADAHIQAAAGEGYGYGGYVGHHGIMTSTGVILVLFILLVIVSRAFII